MSQAEPLGTIALALGHGAQLLDTSPELAAEQAREILRVEPHCAPAQLLLGQALGQLGDGDGAIVALRAAVSLQPTLAEAWLALADHLLVIGATVAADNAYVQHVRHSTRDPEMLAAAAALLANQVPEAEARLRQRLKQQPTDVAAIRMLAEVAARIGRYGDSENLLARCLELAPGFHAARHNYALVLQRNSKIAAALAQVDQLLGREPRNPGYRNLKAAILGRIGDYEESLQLYASVLREYPGQAKVWMSYGHALKSAGREADSIAAYRKCSELLPNFGEAYWSLANLKTFRFTANDVSAMRAQLARTDLSSDDRFHFQFALGKALEDLGEYAESFACYNDGNRLRRASLHYDGAETTAHVQHSKALLTSQFFAAHRDCGSSAADPIFIVGLPRAGSTLLEQIISSHSQVEGTMELPDIAAIVRELGGGGSRRARGLRYPQVLAELSSVEFRALGERYLAATRIQRKTAAPFFIDKMPNNFAHIGLIHLILPNAKIIDARRHPLGCCFSAFKQHFARGQAFSYSLQDVGLYYRDYVELMAHFDAVLPGRVHRVLYETMVADTESEVRAVLNYCGLPFEENCLRFYENERAVRTASSQQVRQPIYRSGVDQWRQYNEWLDPLRQALGPVLDAYPGVPVF